MPINTTSLRHQKLVFWTALLLIVIASLLSLMSIQRAAAMAESAQRSQQVLVDAGRLLSSLKDVETGARGFIITRDERYLEPFRTGRVEFEESQRRLGEVARDNGEIQLHLRRLVRLGEERIELARQAAENVPEISVTADTLQFVEAGRRTMDLIRQEAEALIAAEQTVYADRARAVDRQTMISNAATIFAVALSLAAMAWLFGLRGREVTRRRSAEEDLRMLNTELEQRVQERTAEVEGSRELLDAVIENMPDTVFLKDVEDESRYLLINEAGERFLGRNRTELIGHVDHELFPREQADACRKEDLEVAASGRERLILERSIDTGDGVRLVESRKVPIEDPGGDRRLVLGIVRDITEQKSLETQVRQMQRMDAVGRLTGGVAHDFNNLLAIVMGNAEILRENLEPGSGETEMADEILEAATRGAELVHRMLAFARMQHLEPQPLDLNERLPEMASLLRRTLGENIEVHVVPSPGLWSALADPGQVDDALLNLAINARDAMATGGSLTIESANVYLDEDYAAHHSEVVPGEYVMLAVSDTGTGMPPSVVARAFEPFFTTKEPGQGTGLGLSQVYGWVKQSGGHIKIYSEPGHGTTFKLYLPRSKSDEEVEVLDAEPPQHVGGNETILVVEDNPNVRRTVVRQLADLGYRSLEADDGAAALKLVESGASFDLMLTDIVMPGGMTGYDLAERAREIRPELRILFTSGYTESAVTNGSADRKGPLLSKPYRKQELGSAIRAVLDE